MNLWDKKGNFIISLKLTGETVTSGPRLFKTEEFLHRQCENKENEEVKDGK